MTATEFRAPAGGLYYANTRADVVAKVPRPLGAVLDVGCGAGGAGRSLRAGGTERLEGVEVHPDMAKQARDVYDVVHEGDVLRMLEQGRIAGPFDLFVLYDVLEHLVDPALVLRSLHRIAAPGARVHLSVPNARHWSLLTDLAVRGTFGYTEWGHRDISHLRWFTRRDMEALLEREGWRVVDSSPAILGRGAAVDRLTRGLLSEFLALQWHVLARR